MHRAIKNGIGFLVLVTMETLTGVTSLSDICQNEVFVANCNENEVVVMTSANYGRMMVSRCVERNYGYMGCTLDVLRLADMFCSGKHTCEIPIPNTEFDDYGHASDSPNKCPNDLKAYLYAEYICLPVFNPGIETCSRSSFEVTQSFGTLASITTAATGIGSENCPYVLKAPEGTYITINITDFATADFTTNICSKYVTIREMSETTAGKVICAGNERDRHVYTSESNVLELRIANPIAETKRAHFLLTYNVRKACKVPAVNDKTSMVKSPDVIALACKVKPHVTWVIRCEDGAWRGELRNCTDENYRVGSVLNSPFGSEGKSRMSNKLSIVLICGIALVLGVLILTIGIVVIKWKKSPYHDVYQLRKNSPTMPPEHYAPNLYPPTLSPNESKDYTYQPENEYAYISDVLPPPPNYMIEESRTDNDFLNSNLENRHLELYNARVCHTVCGEYGTYAHGDKERCVSTRDSKTKPSGRARLDSTHIEHDSHHNDVNRKLHQQVGSPRNASLHYGLDDRERGHNVPIHASRQMHNDIHGYTYDHLMNSGIDSNHKSV